MTLADLNKQIDAEYETETAAILARMTVRPSSERRHAINTLVAALKKNNLWTKLDGLYLFAAHTQQAATLNWCRNAANFTANAPIFTADVGFTGDGVAASLTNTNSDTINTKALDQTASVWVSKVPVVPSKPVITWSGWDWVFYSASSGTQMQCKQGSALWTQAASSRTGLFSCTRTGASAAAVYRDGAKLATETRAYNSALTFLPTAPIRVLFDGNAGYSSDTVSALSYGAAMTDLESARFYNAVNDYMVAVDLAGNQGV
jgi:hypothetical protein